MASHIDFSFRADNVPAPEPPQSSAREGRRTTASGVSANLFGRHHFDLDTVAVIFEHLEPRDLTRLLSVSRSWYGVRDRVRSRLRQQFLVLDKRTRFTPLPPVTSTIEPPGLRNHEDSTMWPFDCWCQSRAGIRGNVDPARASVPQLATGVTTLQRALSMRSVRIRLKGRGLGQDAWLHGLSLGTESALSCITVGDVQQLAKWQLRDGAPLNHIVMFELSRKIQMRHLDAPLIAYIREEMSCLEVGIADLRAQCCLIRTHPRWTKPAVGNLVEETYGFPAGGHSEPLNRLPQSVARRIQEAGLPLPNTRFVLTDDFILWVLGGRESIN